MILVYIGIAIFLLPIISTRIYNIWLHAPRALSAKEMNNPLFKLVEYFGGGELGGLGRSCICYIIGLTIAIASALTLAIEHLRWQ